MNTYGLEKNLYTAREACLTLAKYRQSKVPDRTFRYWKSQLGVKPTGPGGLYTSSDLKDFVRLIRWLSRGGTIPQFIEVIKRENSSNGNRSECGQSEQQIIDVEAAQSY